VATNGENVLEGLHAIIKLVILHLKNQLSIFQKDKTVMFSREEITSSTPKPEEKKVVLKNMAEEIPVADTEDEEVFELSSPMVDAEDSLKAPGDEDIFNLEDAQEMKNEKSDIEVPGINFADEEQKDTDSVKVTAIKTDEDTGERPLKVMPTGKTIDLPITLEIPDDSEDVKINLNLKITLKKK
jgi:hypothetical protein